MSTRATSDIAALDEDRRPKRPPGPHRGIERPTPSPRPSQPPAAGAGRRRRSSGEHADSDRYPQ